MHGKAEVVESIKKDGVETSLSTGKASESVKSPEAPTGSEDILATVEYAEGATINLGNFTSYRVDVALKLPARAKGESLEKVYKYAQLWVQGRVSAAVIAVQASQKK